MPGNGFGNVSLPDKLLARLDTIRRTRDDLPSRAALIREYVERGLQADERKRRKS